MTIASAVVVGVSASRNWMVSPDGWAVSALGVLTPVVDGVAPNSLVVTPGFWLLLGSCCVVLLALRPARGGAALRIIRLVAVVGAMQVCATAYVMVRPAVVLPVDATVAAADGALSVWPWAALVGSCLVSGAAMMAPVDSAPADEADGLHQPIEV